MTVDVFLFWGRVAFLVGLYVFVLFVVLSLRTGLRQHATTPDETAPGELVVVEPAESGLRPNDAFPLMRETFLGRLPENTIQITDGTVSGRHGKLIFGQDGWVVEDLGSRNGTFVNGRRVSKRSRVAYGDVVALGSVSLKLVQS